MKKILSVLGVGLMFAVLMPAKASAWPERWPEPVAKAQTVVTIQNEMMDEHLRESALKALKAGRWDIFWNLYKQDKRVLNVRVGYPNRYCLEGQTPLHFAVSVMMLEGGPNKKELKKLIAAGAILDAPDGKGRTALSYAAESHNLEIVNILLNAGAFVDVVDGNGDTPLTFAIWGSDIPLFNTLIRHKATVFLGDNVSIAFSTYPGIYREDKESATSILKFIVRQPSFKKEYLYKFAIVQNYGNVDLLRISLAGFAKTHSVKECHRLVKYIEGEKEAASMLAKFPAFVKELKAFDQDPQAYSVKYM